MRRGVPCHIHCRPNMAIKEAACLWKVHLCKRCIERTTSCEENVVNLPTLLEESADCPFVGDIKDGHPCRTTECAEGTLKLLLVATDEDKLRTLCVSQTGRLKANPRAPSKNDDLLLVQRLLKSFHRCTSCLSTALYRTLMR